MDTYLILFLISLGLNLIMIMIIALRKSPSEITFDEAFFILDSTIGSQKTRYFRGLAALSRRHTVLGMDGRSSPPTDRIEEYSKKKQELKTAITKKIMRNISPLFQSCEASGEKSHPR